MGLIESFMGLVFGGGRNALRETVEVFRPNAEAGEVRDAARAAAALAQFAAEFGHPRKGWFDRMIDGLNRLPRPMLAFGTLGLFAAAMADPVWFATRMQGIALVPEPLWWLMGAIVSFYFGARHQSKTQSFQRGLAETLSRTPEVLRNIQALEDLRAEMPVREDEAQPIEDVAPGASSPASVDDGDAPNAALDDWRRSLGR